MTMRLQLRIQQLPINSHLKTTAIGWNERHSFNHMLVILEQFLCQAHGPTQVVSDRAINDFDFQHLSSSGMQELAPATSVKQHPQGK